MEPCFLTIPSILLHASWLSGYGVWSTGRFGWTKAEAILIGKVCRRIDRMAEKLDMVRIVPMKRNWRIFRRYGSKVRTLGNLCTIQRWGEWCKVKMHPLKYTIPNNGGIQFTGLKEAPTFRMYSYVARYLESKERWFKGCHPKRLL